MPRVLVNPRLRATVVGCVLLLGVALLVTHLQKPAECGRAAACAPPPATAIRPLSATAALHRERLVLTAKGYTPDQVISIPVAGKSTLDVFHSVCTGSADGKCQEMDAFRRGSTTPLWSKGFTDVVDFRATRSGFILRAANFRAGDPLCCPSGGTTSYTYRWTGQALRLQARVQRP